MFLKNKRLIIIFATSLLAHVIMIYVMANSTKLPAMAEMDMPDQQVIQARLIFELPPKAEAPEDPPPEPELEPEQPQIPPIEPESAKAQIIQDVIKETVIVDDSQSQTPLPDTLPEDDKEAKTQATEAEPYFVQDTNSIESAPQNPLTNMARRHLSHFQQQQRNKVAEQASRDYQQQKNSPTMDEEVKNRFLSEDEKFRNTHAIKADCSSAGKKTTAVLLSFLGGQIDCSSPPPINSFIQNRINKNAQLPSLKQEHKTSPKSVVIEKQ